MGRRSRRARRRIRRRMGLETDASSASKTQGAGPLGTGLILLLLGGFFMAERVGVMGFDIERAWPGILILVGFSLLISAPFRGGAAKVLPGLINLLLGFFFLLFTQGVVAWDRLESLWPVFPLIVGIAFAGTFLASFGRKPGLLVPSAICCAVGTIGLAFTVTPLGSFFSFLGWPMILLSLGALFVLGGLLSLVARSLLGLARLA
ncbi:MAG: DUF5668 domain-containing protein [Acidobacteriota bacterium]